MKIDLQEVGRRGKEYIDLAQDTDRCRALMNMVVNILVP